MLIPSFKKLSAEIVAEGYQATYASVTYLHPNPRFYKYYWWVFWMESPCDGEAFLDTRNRLCIAEAFSLMIALQQQKQSHWIYNTRLPRLDSNNPFDPNAKNWRGYEWAPAFHDDNDAVYKIYK